MLYEQRRVKMKKPIFDDYIPMQKTQVSQSIIKQMTASSQLSRSVGPIYQNMNFNNGSNINTSTKSLYSSQNILQSYVSPMRKKEKIFQLPKQPLTISKNTLIDLSNKEHKEFKDFDFQQQDNQFTKISQNLTPIHFQLDEQLTHRNTHTPSQTQSVEGITNSKYKLDNDKFIKIGIILIVVLIAVVITLKIK